MRAPQVCTDVYNSGGVNAYNSRSSYIFSGSQGNPNARSSLPPKAPIVDDEKLIAETLATIFNKSGYEARSAFSAEQALEVIAEWEPAIALLDVVLPAMTGIDLGILLRATRPSINVILMSGQIVAGALVGDAAKDGHSFEILAKPIAVPELLESAARLLEAN
jgi:DNA-binding NtrC family response regulator